MRKGLTMNNTFDFKRFGQVLARDWKNYFRNFGVLLVAWCLLPVLLWIVTLIIDVRIGSETRCEWMWVWNVLPVLMIAPSKVYGEANLPRKGVGFAMLPATRLEKFLSMVVYCSFLTPLIVSLGSWIVDSLLSLMPFGGFEGPIVRPFKFPTMYLVTFTAVNMLTTSIFMFGNMVFKKGKAGKTIAWGLLLLFVITMILQLFGFWRVFGRWMITTTQEHLPYINAAFMFVLSIVFYYLTYRRIKNQKY